MKHFQWMFTISRIDKIYILFSLFIFLHETIPNHNPNQSMYILIPTYCQITWSSSNISRSTLNHLCSSYFSVKLCFHQCSLMDIMELHNKRFWYLKHQCTQMLNCWHCACVHWWEFVISADLYASFRSLLAIVTCRTYMNTFRSLISYSQRVENIHLHPMLLDTGHF